MRIFAKLLRRPAKLVSRFCRARRGATAVEFALVVPAFLATLLAVFQTTFFLFAQQVLQNAAVEAGRLFMTGQGQNSGLTSTQLNNDICPMIQALFTCSSVMVDVQNYSAFGGANVSSPTLSYDAQGNVTNTWNFSPGTQGQIMVVRLIYQWPIVSGPFGYVLKNLGNGKTEMMGVSAFRVEPYATGGG